MSEEKEIIKKTKKEIQEIRKQFIVTVKNLAVTSLGLVAALAWNAAIQKLFEVVFPNKANSLIAMFTYAAFITIIIVFITYYFTKLADKIEKEDEK